MSRKLRRRGPTERFVALRYYLLQSPAWRSLPGNARALYVELAARYNGSNNGRIPYSIRQAIEALHIGSHTAIRLLALLQDRGFIVCTKKGAFSMKAVRDASEWRLTEYQDDVRPDYPTKEFMRWQPFEPESNEPPKSKTRLLRRNRTVAQAKPHGCSGETVNAKKGPHGCYPAIVNAQNSPSTVSPEQHIQLPGTASAREGGERSAPEGSAVASEPPDWNALGYPPDAPSREEHLAALERAALECGRSLSKRRAGGT
jgi:hypothetical protein